MAQKYYYVNQRILDRYSCSVSDLRLADIFLGLRAGMLMIVVFFLGYFFVSESSLPQKIHSPLTTTLAEESDIKTPFTSIVQHFNSAEDEPTQPPTVTGPEIEQEAVIPDPVKLSKNSYSIAVFGDSMVDTMGERLEYLEHTLKKKYPNTDFNLYNFGKGAQNCEEGLARLHSPLDYQDRHYPTLDEIKPDVLIIGSFAYNPFSPHDSGRYRSCFSQLVSEGKTISGRIYVLAEIAPLKVNFGKGPGGVNWDDNTAYQQATRIIGQLENAIDISQFANVPLINAFISSQISADKSGNPKYVNSSDGIHPSVAGHEFMADLITDTLRFN